MGKDEWEGLTCQPELLESEWKRSLGPHMCLGSYTGMVTDQDSQSEPEENGVPRSPQSLTMYFTSRAEATPASDPAWRPWWWMGSWCRQADRLDSGTQGHRVTKLKQCQVTTGLILRVVRRQQHPQHRNQELMG